jgi:site-specific DNA recombinase
LETSFLVKKAKIPNWRRYCLLEGVEAFCASVRRSREEPSFEVKQKVLQLVVDRIVVEESRVVIQHVVPTGAVRLQTEQHGQK